MDFFLSQLPSTSTVCTTATETAKFEHQHENAAKMFFAERKPDDLDAEKSFYIEKRCDATTKRTCPQFLKLKKALDDEYNEKKKKLDTIRSLRLHAAERCREAELNAALLNLREMETMVVRQQCEGTLEHKMGQLKAETDAVEETLRREICNSNSVKCENGKSQKDVPNGRNEFMSKYLVECKESSKYYVFRAIAYAMLDTSAIMRLQGAACKEVSKWHAYAKETVA